MALSSGSNLGPYQILEPLGRGGMGEVYRARDNKLGRDVAIKVLPEDHARDADHVARFQREAQVLASLNHPNVGAIYDLQKHGNTNFLILELRYVADLFSMSWNQKNEIITRAFLWRSSIWRFQLQNATSR